MRSRWIGFAAAVVAVGLSLWAYPSLPPTIPTHWNLDGQVDGYSARWFGAFLLPAVILVARVVFGLLPRIDPLRANYPAFLDTYWLFVNAILVFLTAVHAMVIANGLGFTVNPSRLVPVAAGILFVVLGNVLTRVKPNWFLGIRTPWTLSDEHVWRKTHRVGGWLFVLGGVVILGAAALTRGTSAGLVVIVLAIIAGFSLVYSYLLWRSRRHEADR